MIFRYIFLPAYLVHLFFKFLISTIQIICEMSKVTGIEFSTGPDTFYELKNNLHYFIAIVLSLSHAHLFAISWISGSFHGIAQERKLEWVAISFL